MRMSDWSSDVCSSDLLFRELREPVVENFEPTDKIDLKLREAVEELCAQEIAMGAMTASLLKQVIVALVRRSMKSSRSWTDRFSILADRQLTRAFADMVARPGAAHTVQSLAHSAGLSRSARSEESRVGKEWVSTFRTRGSP